MIHFRAKRYDRRGFSLIELGVVMAIMAMLIAMVFPAMQKAREVDARTQCINNYKQIGLACHGFEATFKHLPPLYGGSKGQVANSVRFPTVWGSTQVFLLPFIEQDKLYTKLATGTPANYDPKAGAAQNTAVFTYTCPLIPA